MDDSIRIIRLSDDYNFKSFDCGNDDLNDFLLSNAKDYVKRLLSVTYILEVDDAIVAYFSVSNDKIAIPERDKATWRKIKSLFPHSKHRSDYPAVKIGRLAVSKDYKQLGIGTDILNFVKKMFVTNNRTGCCFVTVDALIEAIPFYLHNGFSYLKPSEKNDLHEETVSLYFNLAQML